MTSSVQQKRDYDPVEVHRKAFWETTAEEREESFRILREKRPVSWHRPIEGGLMTPEQDGFWAIVRNADIAYCSKHPEIFSSAHGIQMEEVPEDLLDAAESFLGMDDPQHARIRKLISAAFTPKQVARIEDQIKDQARRIVDDLLDAGDCDFVSQVSKKLPMWTIYEMMGVPTEYREPAAHAADGMVSWADSDVAAGREPGEVLTDSLMTLLTTGMQLAEERRSTPGNDLMTNLVQAEVDGEALTDEEIGAFFVLLSVAGNDTTRNTITLTAKALQDFPDQRRLLRDDFEGTITTAMEEFVRWVTPVMTFRRTLLQDTELHGQRLRAGEWIALFYSSGNRDFEVWDDPYTFDITRKPNPHVGFGGGGPHYCLGNMLAKSQLRAIFDQLLTRVPNLEVGEPELLAGNFVRGVKSLPCSF